jgi:hypothetical protein
MNRTTAAVLAGAAGGAAEILWIAGVAPDAAADVAREVAATFSTGAGALAGVAIHMVLSVALGLAAAKLLLGLAPQARMVAAVSLLALVWALNFLVVLPLVNPAFVTLLPLGVTFGSKLLFGAVLGGTLQLSR